MWWRTDFISWDKSNFCGIGYVSVPSELLWKPDIIIEEMMERDRANQSPYLNIANDGTVVYRNGMVLVSTCRMQFYRFPLDTQVCHLTFKSITHFAQDLKIFHLNRDNDTTHDGMHAETEWGVTSITFESKNIRPFHFDLSVLICTITMKRRSVLYVVNFILPILFFLGLDLASFLISENRGEKLGFKVTVLLAITVMQLILNDILPSSSDSIPLIAVYCVGVFGMMMLSLLETILVMYLQDKDNVSPDKDQNQSDNFGDKRGETLSCFQGINKSISCVRLFNVSPTEMPSELVPSELLPLEKEGSRSQLTEESPDSEKIYSELSEVLKALTQLLGSKKEEVELGYWTRMTRRIDRIYFIIYIITASGSTDESSNHSYYEESYDQQSTPGGSTNVSSNHSSYEESYDQQSTQGGSTNVSSNHSSYEESYDQQSTQDQNSSDCSYINLLNHLNLTDKVKFSMTRPTRNHSVPTEVYLFVHLYAILDVSEKEQKFVAYIWIYMWWHNDFISWDKSNFCDIYAVAVPSELLWKPDIIIEEMTEKDRANKTPYLKIYSYGDVVYKKGMVMVSTCRMQFYRFPLDTQVCHLTFKSITLYDHELKIDLEGSKKTFHDEKVHAETKAETDWSLKNMSCHKKEHQHICTITMERQSVLYVVNFILPILFFLGLDLASFLISESRGEKLSFKVTVLLAITVMQLILNDILPSSSDGIPLIAVYCVGVFGMMMLSLLETILVMYLMDKDNVSSDKDQNLCDHCGDKRGETLSCFQGINKSVSCVRIFNVSPAEMPSELVPSELLPLEKEGSRSQLTEESHDSEKIYSELSEVLKALTQLLGSKKEEVELGYWTRMTRRIDRIYFIIYIITLL
ncbi:hypothetical protein FQN60_002939 [Xyrichtys novacula]|uniref:5-hydroxytryptamine receptor 3A-like n=1 Tax=Xyrichtys novacula TaxID=13765 RepID=A0AAV1EN03_XYRNO|nr:hypothetical protein FQN60_002939 [Xyrichtys novacula]